MSTMQDEVKLLKREQVMRYCNISNGLLYDLMAVDKFPHPIRITPRTVRWHRDDLDKWIEAQRTPQKEPAPVAA